MANLRHIMGKFPHKNCNLIDRNAYLCQESIYFLEGKILELQKIYIASLILPVEIHDGRLCQGGEGVVLDTVNRLIFAPKTVNRLLFCHIFTIPANFCPQKTLTG